MILDELNYYLNKYVLLIGVATVVICLAFAFAVGERSKTGYPERWRRRARYLRWLSMAALAGMGLLIALVVRAPLSAESGALGTSIVLGLIVAMMASVYRYIVRLGYFYEARADSAELLSDENGKMRNLQDKASLMQFMLLCRTISPDELEYPEAESLLGEIGKIKKDLVDKK